MNKPLTGSTTWRQRAESLTLRLAELARTYLPPIVQREESILREHGRMQERIRVLEEACKVPADVWEQIRDEHFNMSRVLPELNRRLSDTLAELRRSRHESETYRRELEALQNAVAEHYGTGQEEAPDGEEREVTP